MIEQDALFSLIASGDLLSVNGLEGLENGEDQSGVGSVNVCEHCNKIFLKNSNYQTHLRTHTGEKPFVCCICTKQFARADYLKAHLISHSGARPYTCGICEKTFTHVSSLNTHIRIHTGERPYACHVCPRSFTKSSDLQRHLDIHREKLFTCFMCDKRFARIITLKKHLERCNGSLAEDISSSYTSPWKMQMPYAPITRMYKRRKYRYEEDIDELDSDEDYEPFKKRRNFQANSAIKNGDHKELEKAAHPVLNTESAGSNVFVEVISKEHNEDISNEMSHESPSVNLYTPTRNALTQDTFVIGNGRTLFDSSTDIGLPLQTFPLEIGMFNIAQFQ